MCEQGRTEERAERARARKSGQKARESEEKVRDQIRKTAGKRKARGGEAAWETGAEKSAKKFFSPHVFGFFQGRAFPPGNRGISGESAAVKKARRGGMEENSDKEVGNLHKSQENLRLNFFK